MPYGVQVQVLPCAPNMGSGTSSGNPQIRSPSTFGPPLIIIGQTSMGLLHFSPPPSDITLGSFVSRPSFFRDCESAYLRESSNSKLLGHQQSRPTEALMEVTDSTVFRELTSGSAKISKPEYNSDVRGVTLPRMEVGSSSRSVHWAEALFEAHAAGLVLYGRALGLCHSESEDVVQDVFSALLTLGEPPRNPPHYLVRSFRNRALNCRRSLWRRLTRELESQDWFEPSAEPHPAEARAMDELSRLPAEQREVIVLRFWHGMTFEEIAEVTGVGQNTAAGRFRYGMDRLRKHLKMKEDPSFFPCFNA